MFAHLLARLFPGSLSPAARRRRALRRRYRWLLKKHAYLTERLHKVGYAHYRVCIELVRTARQLRG